ncbi:MAG: hypothetical protein ACM3PY_09100, partial [Omnitrophica WOR_2 bacterium]
MALCIQKETLHAYRSMTHRTKPGQRLNSADEAVQFVNERGFVFFWPINEIVLPSLWVARAGDRPVTDEHDDPGHATWGWKDSLLGQNRWYYAKVLRKRGTMISLEVAPYFYALTENYGAPDEDYLTLYEQGKLTLESKLLYETLLKQGALDTITLRKAAHLTSRDSESRFNKALTDLQSNFQVLPVGVCDAGAWHYAYKYDLVHRQFPGLIDQTRFITERQARRKLAEHYLGSAGAAQTRDLVRLFGWTAEDANR